MRQECVRILALVTRRANRIFLLSTVLYCHRDEWVPVATAWRVLRLRMEEWPPIWRVAANILNRQSPTADKGWSSSLRFEQGAKNLSGYEK
jgi:hypothetical protein